ncbi:MAG: hypothetical protein AAF630_00075 [Cyanobacteria bacterium P01_C01_bin.38]
MKYTRFTLPASLSGLHTAWLEFTLKRSFGVISYQLNDEDS